MSHAIRIERATPADTDAIEALLVRTHLPPDDLAAHIDCAFVARTGGRVVGSSAIELYEDGGLLRSVAVDDECRDAGLGARLTEAAIDEARRRALPALYLLTTSADRYFPRFGFDRIDRGDVPPSIQRSVQFGSVCPQSAVAMRLRLS